MKSDEYWTNCKNLSIFERMSKQRIPSSSRSKTNSVVHNTRPYNSFNNGVRNTQKPTHDRPCPRRMKEIVPLLVEDWEPRYHKRQLRKSIKHHVHQPKKQARKIKFSMSLICRVQSCSQKHCACNKSNKCNL